MKQLLLICVLALQLFGAGSIDARTVTNDGTEAATKKSCVSPLLIQQEHPADISQTVRVANTALKARYNRSTGAAVSLTNSVNVLAVPSAKDPDNYNSPLYLPLIRLLLYPKHYFW